MLVNPKDLIIITRTGADTISETFYPSETAGRYVLSSIRIKYTAGSTSATVTLSVDHRMGSAFDFQLFQITAAGGGGSDVNVGIASDELKEWYFDVAAGERDGLLVSQTLAASDTWSIEVAFADAQNL